VLLNCCDGASGEVCGSVASCVQEGMRSVARLRNTEGLSGVAAVWPAFVGVSGTDTVHSGMSLSASVGVLLQWVDFIVNVCLLFLIEFVNYISSYRHHNHRQILSL
jgi:hypothetical protein